MHCQIKVKKESNFPEYFYNWLLHKFPQKPLFSYFLAQGHDRFPMHRMALVIYSVKISLILKIPTIVDLKIQKHLSYHVTVD